MKVVGQSVRADRNRLPQPLASLVETLRRDPEWLRDSRAQDVVVNALSRILDNRYYLIRNATIEELEIPIPLILVGPPGVWVLYPSAQKGIFRAKGDEWEKMEDRRRTYSPANPNLITRASLLCNAVETYLSTRSLTKYKIEPVLIFTDPGTHIETVHPTVRIVLMDALDRFVNSLINSALIISWKESQVLVSVFSKEIEVEENKPLDPERDIFSFIDERQPLKIPEISIPLPKDENVVKAFKRVPFTNYQLLFLGMMIIFNILLVAGFVILILLLG